MVSEREHQAAFDCVTCRPVRDTSLGIRDFIDYLEEVRPGMDYGSVESRVYRLVRLFWWEVLQINPTQVDLSLTRDVATTWRTPCADHDRCAPT